MISISDSKCFLSFLLFVDSRSRSTTFIATGSPVYLCWPKYTVANAPRPSFFPEDTNAQ